ncbi:MAG: bifunctional phosphopantothenoylcysteine decarboxylase/phosphopantothenate--cysteine ligase CoaBC [Bauldia sp.]
MLRDKRILLIIGGGIAAYKSLDLIRRLRDAGAVVRPVMTAAAREFVTPLAVGTLSGGKVFTDLFDRDAEHDVSHIRLAREADLILIAPATADLLAKTALGLANDLATTILLAAKVPVLAAPAMNPAMWANPATQRNVTTLRGDGIRFVGPVVGEMAESGEAGLGRMAEIADIVTATGNALRPEAWTHMLDGVRVLVTAGPTHEPLDPVRYLANRSSGKQGFAIAAAAGAAGAEVTLVTGPVTLPDPAGVAVVRVETAAAMLAAVERALPVDVAVMAAAVGDWRAARPTASKLKKGQGSGLDLELVANDDILAAIGKHPRHRPKLVIGFAAETERVVENATAKRTAKGADWIIANDVSATSGIMGGDENEIRIVTAAGAESWPRMPKTELGERIVERIAGMPGIRTAG